MANKIGIVLALDGEKEFTQGMKSAQQSAKLFQQNLKNLDKEYQGNANSIEALTKKQEQLRQKQEAYNRELTSAKGGQKNAIDQYKKTGERLEELKQDLEKAKKAMSDMEKAGDNSSKAYKDQAKAVEQLEKAVQKQSEEQARASTNITKWDTAVAKAEGDVKDVNRELQKNDKYLDEASRSADGCAKSIDKMGKEMDQAEDEAKQLSISLKDMVKAKVVDLAGDAVQALGQKAIEAAKYVVEVGARFEQSMSKVEALSGATSAELEEMSMKAQELGSTTRFSASEVADGFSYMALAGWSTQEMLSSIDGVVNLAAASEMDLAQASDMVTDYLSAFGMEASEAGHMADMMAYAQANSNTSTTQLGEAFANCAANAHANGQSMKTTTAILEAFANQGLKGSRAGTVLSAMMRDITQKMEDGKIMIGDTAVAVTDSEGNFRSLTEILGDVESATQGMTDEQRTSALQSVFTAKSITGVNMALAEGVGNIASYEAQLDECDGAAAGMATTMNNNLNGAITELNSAAEGLGIKLYGYVKGPLTTAVSIATGLLQGLTQIISPQKSELEEYLEEVQAANDEARAALDNANSTLEQGAADVLKLDSLAGIVKAANEEFDIFKAQDTSAAATDLSDTAAAMEDPGSKITSLAEAIVNGYDFSEVDTSDLSSDLTDTETDVSKTGEDLETDASDIVSAMNGIGEVDTSGADANLSETAKGIGTSKTAIKRDARQIRTGINDIGKADTSGAAANLETTKGKFSTTSDEFGRIAETLKEKIADIGKNGINSETIHDGLAAIRAGAQSTMDEFTKWKVQNAITELAKEIPAIGEAWDGVTGKLNMTEQEFDNLIDAQKRAIMETSLAKAQSDAMAAVASATIAQRMSQDALNELLEEASAAAGKEIKTAEDLAAWDVAEEVAEKYRYQIQQVEGELDEANGTLAEAEDLQGKVEKAAGSLADEWGLTEQSAEETGEAVSELNGELSEEEQAERRAAKAAHDAQEEIRKAHRDAADEIVKAYDDAKQAAKDAFSINPFDEWAQNAEQGVSAMQKAFDSQIDGLTNYTSNLATVSDHVGQEITPEFLNYLEELGVGGAQVVQELAEAFESGDTEKVEALMSSYTQAMDIQDEVSDVLAADKLAYKLGIDDFASTTKEWAEIDDAVTYLAQWGDEIHDSTRDAFLAAKKTAQEMGVAIPDGLKEGIENGNEAPDAALQTATQMLEQAIQGRMDGVLEAATEAGFEIPPSIADGINEGGEAAQTAYQELIDLITSGGDTGGLVEKSKEAGREGGAAVGEGYSEGAAESAGEAESAAQSIADGAAEAASTASETFTNAGTKAGALFAAGVRSKSDDIGRAGSTVAREAVSQAQQTLLEMQNVGANGGGMLASGLLSQTGNAASAGGSVASAAKSGAASWENSFYSVGVNMGSGIKSGLQSQVDSIASQAAAAVRAAVNAAKAEASIASPSKKMRDEVGKMMGKGTAIGLALSTKNVSDAAATMVEQTVNAAVKAASKLKSKAKKSALWDLTSDKAIANNFGVVNYTESKDSKGNVTRKNKTNATYYSEILTQAEKYFEQMSARRKISAADEEAYWTKVRKQLKVGTDAYLSASKKISSAKEEVDQEKLSKAEKAFAKEVLLNDTSLKDQKAYWKKQLKEVKKGGDAYLEIKEKIADINEDINNKMITDGDSYVAKQIAQGKMSAKQEVEYWQKIQKSLKKGSDAYKDAAQRISDAKAKMGSFDAAESLLSTWQIYFDMSEKAEMDYWDKVRKLYAKGSSERTQADQKYFESKKNYLERLKEIETDYTDAVAEATEKYNDALNARIDTLKNAFDLFDAFESQSATGEELLYNMKTQAEGYQFWREQIEALQKRGILSSDLINELTERGPQDTAAIVALNSLDNKQLSEYNAAYLKKMDMVQAQATKDVREDAKVRDASIQKAKNDQKAAMAELNKDLDKNLASAADKLKETASQDVDRIIQAIYDANQKSTSTSSGAKKTTTTTKTTTTAASATVTIPETAEEKAAREHQQKIDADRAAYNKEQQLKRTIADIIASGASRSKTIADSEKSHVALWKYIVSKYGRTPTNAMYKQLASVLGISVKDKPTKAEKNKILNAMKSHGMRSGTRRLTTPYAWMDEEGYGSEMIIRQSDGARLNTAANVGDAIIPAAATENLWKWSQLDPGAVLSAGAMNSRAAGVYGAIVQDTNEIAGRMGEMLALMAEYMPYIPEAKTLSVDGKELARATADYTGNTLAMRTRRMRG